MSSSFIIYTDGSCKNYIGGYAFVVIDDTNQILYQEYGRVPNRSTNQTSELYAIYRALIWNSNNITIITDSKYSINCITQWYKRWEKNGWKTTKGNPVSNSDLIKEIVNLTKDKQIYFKHVKSHKGDVYNEYVDRLANIARIN